MKKLLSAILIFALTVSVFACVPALTAFAATSGTCGDNLTWEYDTSTATLTISGTGTMNNYNTRWNSTAQLSVTTAPWDNNFKWIKTVVINNGVTSIGFCAFYNCIGLTSINIPDSVTSIGGSAFKGCTGITSITMGNGVTSIGSSAFEGCTGITSVTIPKSVTSIGTYAFNGCYGLTEVIYTGTFEDWCNISISMNPLFYAHNLYINGQIVAGDLIIPDSVKNITETFCGCTGITSITIPDGVTSIGSYAFYECTGLTSITIPKSVTSIGDFAFYGCTGLTSVYYTGTEDDWKNIINSANAPLKDVTKYYINNCGAETNWYIHNNVLHITGTGNMDNYKMQNAVPWYEYKDEITKVLINSGVEKIGSYAFYCLDNLESITTRNKELAFGKYAFNTGNENITVYAKKAGAVETYCTENDVKFVDPTPTPEAPAAPDYQAHTENSITLAPNRLYEFSIDGETWQKSNVFTGLEKNVIYHFYQRLKETDIEHALDISPALIIALPDKPVILTAAYDSIMVKPVTGFEYCLDDMVWQSDKTFDMLIDETEYYVYQRLALVPGEKVYQITSDYTAATTDNSIIHTHTFDEWVTIIEPDCTKKGEKEHTCTGCGYIEKQDIDALGHNPAAAVREKEEAPTCTVSGSYEEVVYCSVCGVELSRTPETSDATGHDYIETVDSKYLKSAADCTHKAVYYKSCSHCGITDTETFENGEPLGHNYNSVVTDPTCTEKGYTTHTCTRCGDSYTDAETDAHGHTFGEWSTTVKPTCTEKGEEKHTCTVCGTVEKRPVDELGHRYVKTVHEATCTEEGYTDNICSRCGDEYESNYTDPLGHDWSAEWSTDSSNHWHKCTHCDEINDCAAHTFGEWIETKPATTKETGEQKQICAVCGYEQFEEIPIIIITGDLNGDDKVTDDDAIYLLFHTFFPEDYPIEQDCDFDGDNEVTDKDAIYLLFYTFFPEDYPI